MHFAYRDHIDYLLFWDDDEYPIANIKDQDKLIWKRQNNIRVHLENIKNADITTGYHCGYISPIPYINLSEKANEIVYKNFIESISNDIISWKSIKTKMMNDGGITYADPYIANEKGIYEIELNNGGKWVSGSTLCLNLQHIDKIPAFYNPINARGEDTFFATKLKNAKVLKVPVYHFHDGFLMYTDIMLSKYPKILKRADLENSKNFIKKRFFNACIGWIRYKPLLMYITDKANYNENIKVVYNKLESSISKMNEIFKGYDFSELLEELEKYSNNVRCDYEEYVRTNEIWNRLKK